MKTLLFVIVMALAILRQAHGQDATDASPETVSVPEDAGGEAPVADVNTVPLPAADPSDTLGEPNESSLLSGTVNSSSGGETFSQADASQMISGLQGLVGNAVRSGESEAQLQQQANAYIDRWIKKFDAPENNSTAMPNQNLANDSQNSSGDNPVLSIPSSELIQVNPEFSPINRLDAQSPDQFSNFHSDFGSQVSSKPQSAEPVSREAPKESEAPVLDFSKVISSPEGGKSETGSPAAELRSVFKESAERQRQLGDKNVEDAIAAKEQGAHDATISQVGGAGVAARGTAKVLEQFTGGAGKVLDKVDAAVDVYVDVRNNDAKTAAVDAGKVAVNGMETMGKASKALTPDISIPYVPETGSGSEVKSMTGLKSAGQAVTLLSAVNNLNKGEKVDFLVDVSKLAENEGAENFFNVISGFKKIREGGEAVIEGHELKERIEQNRTAENLQANLYQKARERDALAEALISDVNSSVLANPPPAP